MIADEVQTGLGRTGRLWGVDHWGVEPDIICLGKALGGGVMPISAFCSTKEIWQRMMYPNPFLHTTTTGGNPLACAAAIAAIRVTLRDKLWEMAGEKGEYFLKFLQPLVEKYSDIIEKVTGRGLLLAMHFHDTQTGYVAPFSVYLTLVRYLVASGLFRRGVIISGTLNSAQAVRIEPPFVITYEQIDIVLKKLEEALLDTRVQLKVLKEQKEHKAALAAEMAKQAQLQAQSVTGHTALRTSTTQSALAIALKSATSPTPSPVNPTSPAH